MRSTRDWLESIDLGQYADAFEENAIELSQISTLTDDELKELGVAPLGHRKRIKDNASSIQVGITRERDVPEHLAERILASRAALEGERKRVTVLFADVVGSTALIHGLDAEAAVDRLRPAVELMMTAVHRHEGLVNRVQGDSIMAIFGAPLAHEDHAVRACLAAVEMRNKAAAIGDRELQVRVGLNSGEVVVRTIRNDLTMEYEADGPTVHLGARMEQMASPGTVRATENTVRLAAGYVEWRTLGSLPVKGVEGSIRQVEVLSAVEAASRWDIRARRGLTRYVGREAELGILDQALALAGEGHGQVVGIAGEPGMGKSRLLHEFLAARVSEKWTVQFTTASSYGKASPYLPIRELVRAMIAAMPGESSDVLAHKLDCFVCDLGPQFAMIGPALRFIADLPPNDAIWGSLDPEQRRRRIIDAFRSLVLRQAELAPQVLVFEDLHWLDTETQSALDALVENLPGAKLMLLATYRPEYTDAWVGKGWHRRIQLSALGENAAEVLVRTLLGEHPSIVPLRKLVVAATEGRPLFVEESVHALAEEQRIIGSVGKYELIAPLGQLRIPESVQAVLAARIDRLAPDTKRVLQTAAVIGRRFVRSLLQAVCRISEIDLATHIQALQNAEFIFERKVLPEPEYVFKHALTEYVAYDGLLRSQRTRLHCAVLEAMHSLNGTGAENAENLARHAFEGERWQEAVGFLRQVVDRVVRQSAHVEAKEHIERALSALKRLPERPEFLANGVDFRLDLKTVLFALGEVDAISAHLDDAVRLADALGDAPRRARVRYHTCHHLWYTGEHRLALESGLDAQRVATDAGDDQARVEILQRLGSVHHALGNYRAGIEVLQQSDIGVDERSDSPGTPSIFARMFLVWCLAETGDFRTAVPAAEENFRVAEQSGLPWAVIDASMGVGVVHLAQGRPDQALSPLERGVELCETGDLPALRPWVTTYLATARFRCGRAEDGVALLERAIDQAKEMGTLSYQALRATRLAEGYLRSGRLDEAGDSAQRALELARAHSERGHEAWALWVQAEIGRRADSSVQFAEEQYRNALGVAEELGMRPLAAHCHYGLADLRQPNQRTETDRTHLVTAMALSEEMGMVSHPRKL